jgi:uncharacterized membrane protein
MNRPTRTRFVAFVAAMSALSNILGLLVVPVGFVTLHLIQLPMVFSGFAAGSLAGGLVGFFGAFVMAFTLAKPNPYLIPGNAILGFVAGLSYSKIRRLSAKPIFPQIVSVLLAYAIQMPYTYVTDVYLMGMPQPVVVGIISVLLVEDLISALVSHVILYRVDVHALLSQRSQ